MVDCASCRNAETKCHHLINGDIRIICSSCGQITRYVPNPLDCPACDGHGRVVTPSGTFDCPNTECPSKADAKPVSGLRALHGKTFYVPEQESE